MMCHFIFNSNEISGLPGLRGFSLSVAFDMYCLGVRWTIPLTKILVLKFWSQSFGGVDQAQILKLCKLIHENILFSEVSLYSLSVVGLRMLVIDESDGRQNWGALRNERKCNDGHDSRLAVPLADQLLPSV